MNDDSTLCSVQFTPPSGPQCRHPLILNTFAMSARSVIEWSGARTSLYWRLRRRLAENRLLDEVRGASGDDIGQAKKQSHGQTLELLRRWFIEDKARRV